jgi:pimeloyl-ACP methyl ester carboxylesterase
MTQIDTRRITANGIEINVAIAGEGEAILLLHGFPNTWRVWTEIIPDLARTRRVIAPDLRGLGDTTRAADGYDAGTLVEDAVALLDALDVGTAQVVAHDLSVPSAVLLALRHPERVRRLVVMEAVLGGLPGAEGFTTPWWFGFHSAGHASHGLAERVLAGHEAEYVEFFLRAGTYDGTRIPQDVWQAFTAAYTGEESLRCAFAHYRAMGESAAQLASALGERRLTMPVTAIGARPVGGVLARQLAPFADDLSAHQIDECGHIIPLDSPKALLEYLK